MTTAHARIFTRDGNRFLVPGLWYADGDPACGQGSAAVCLTESLLIGTMAGLKPEGWLDVELDEAGHGEIPHVAFRLIGRQFAHGAIDLLLIGGPLFDAKLAEQQAAEMPGD